MNSQQSLIIDAKSARMPRQTNLRHLVNSFADFHLNYNWLLTDVEADFGPFQGASFSRATIKYFSGAELSKLAFQFPEGLIAWGVLTALPLTLKIDFAKMPVKPMADAAAAFWDGSPAIQFPGAVAEVVAWDSSFTILVSKDPELTAAFASYYPEAAPGMSLEGRRAA